MMVVSCLEFPNKGLEKDVVEVSYLKDESEVVQVSVDNQKKNLEGAYGKFDEH